MDIETKIGGFILIVIVTMFIGLMFETHCKTQIELAKIAAARQVASAPVDVAMFPEKLK